MPKKVTNNAPDESAGRKEAPIFVTLVKISADEIVTVEYEQDNLQFTVTMEKPDKQRPVEEFYENFRKLAYHVARLAEMHQSHSEYVRATGIRMKYEGSGRAMSAQLIGWRELKLSQGGYAISLPYKKCDATVTSVTNGEPSVVGPNGEAINADGSNKVRHSGDCTDIILRQIELAESYIAGQRAAITIEDAQEEIELEEELEEAEAE